MAAISTIASEALSLATARNVIFVILLYLPFILLCQIINYRFFHPLRHYPGPFWASVSRLWLAWHHYCGSELQVQWALVQKYGPIVRITPTMLLVADSMAIPAVFHRRDTKARFYIQGYVGESNSILIRDPAAHAAHRRLIGAPYALSNIQKMEPLLNKHILRWVNQMDKIYAQHQKPLDFSHWSHYLAYDTITDLGFRNPLGFIDTGSDVGGLIRGFRVGMLIFGVAGRLYPFTEWLLQSWFKKHLVVRTEQKLGFAVVMEKAGAILTERTKALQGFGSKPRKGDESYDLLQAFMDARTPEGEHLTNDVIKAEIFVILGAGSDGFGSASTAFITEVISRPLIFQRLMAEINAAIEAGHLTYPVPSYAEVSQHLQFYVACVKEALRLNPSGATILPRVVCAEDPELVLGGRTVPVGTEVACNPWICHRDSNVYGEDAEAFNPDRWLTDPARSKSYEKYSLAWGYGARVCLGKPFAMMELYKGPLSLLLNFDVALCEDRPETPAPHSAVYASVIVWGDVWLQLRKRELWALHEAKSSPPLERTMPGATDGSAGGVSLPEDLQ